MIQPAIETATARAIAAEHWGVTDTPRPVELGVNKQTWQVGNCWLAADFPHASTTVERTARLFANMPDSPVSLPTLVPATAGTYVAAAGRIWWMTTNVPGAHPDPMNLTHTTTVAAGLAQVHKCLATLPTDLAVSSESSSTRFHDALELASDQRLGFTTDEQSFLHHAAASVIDRNDHAIQLIHGDPSAPNIKLSATGSTMSGLLDWDNCSADNIVTDLATVAQTVVLRSGTDTPLADLAALVEAYASAGGQPTTVDDVVAALIKAKFSSISHHGRRYLRGEVDREIVYGQLGKIAIIHALL